MNTERGREIERASWIGVFGNGVLSVGKVVVGLISGSLAVTADGVDSATDIVISIVTLLTARIIMRPPDMKYPYGYERADTVAAKLLSFIIFFAGAQLAISTLIRIFGGASARLPSAWAVYVTFFSIAGKLLLAFQQQRAGKRTCSRMLQANARNMRNDVLISGAVLLGLAFTFIFHLPVLDSVVALAVSVWVMKTAFVIFMQTATQLMDGLKSPEIYEKIFTAISGVRGIKNPHRVRVRQSGEMYLMDIDIEVDPTLSVAHAHKLAHEVEDRIRREIDHVYDIVIHIEPEGDQNENEKFGVRPADSLS